MTKAAPADCKPADTFAEISEYSKAYGERNDCTVKALAFAACIPYGEAHAEMKRRGRRNRKGAMPHQYLGALRDRGFDVQPITYPQRLGKTVKTFARRVGSGTYLVRTRRHVLCIVNGEVKDWTAGRQHRVIDAYKIETAQPAPKAKPAPAVEPAPTAPKTEPAKPRKSPRKVAVDRHKDTPDSPLKRSIIAAARELGATSKATAATKQQIAAVAGCQPKQVAHHLYAMQSVGRSVVLTDSRPYRFYLTETA